MLCRLLRFTHYLLIQNENNDLLFYFIGKQIILNIDWVEQDQHPESKQTPSQTNNKKQNKKNFEPKINYQIVQKRIEEKNCKTDLFSSLSLPFNKLHFVPS